MELRQLRYFNAVAELLNFSRAAERLRVAQSALSRQIQALEDEVGAKLFDRDRVHVSLTDAGKAFYARTCKLLLQVDVAVTEARLVASGSQGELVVCHDWRLDAELVSTTVEEFRRKNPRTELILRDAGFHEQIALIRSREAHLGFGPKELLGKNNELEFLPIRRMFFNVALPSRHPLAKRKLIRLSDLAKETWVDLSEKEATGMRAYVIQQCRLSGFGPRLVKSAGSLHALFGYVASGYGVTIVSDHVRPTPGMAVCCVRTDCQPVELCAVWNSGNQSPFLQQFLNILGQQIATDDPKASADAGDDPPSA
jgi:DNA-binding transcriptional LysR family regulator